MADKQIQDTKLLLRDLRVENSEFKKIYVIDEDEVSDIYSKLVTDDNYILEEGVLYITTKAGAVTASVFGDGKGTFSEALALGGGSGGSGVQTVTGDIVNNEDPLNPVVRMPTITWYTVTQKPTTFPPEIGTTATTAKAGNYTPPNVTTTVNGLMLATDKVKLDGIVPATVSPLINGTAAVGTSLLYARQDHVHPLQASTATLTTGRTFALTGGATGTSAAFNGSANASIPVTLAVPTATVRGGVLKQTNLPDLPDEPVDYTDINAIYAVLRGAGLM